MTKLSADFTRRNTAKAAESYRRRACAFDSLTARIEQIIRSFLREKEYVEIYLGRNGDFDISAASAVKRAQKAIGHHNSSLILVQPYHTKNDDCYEEFYYELQYPISSKTHPKAAITKRNEWMIDNSDMLIAYVEKDRNGGALKTLKYAEKAGLKIINLAEQSFIG